MNWIVLDSEKQLDEIHERSATRPQVIFKHSIRCSTSQLVKRRLEREEPPQVFDFYYLDLINNRPVSNKVSETFDVWHESPQVLVIRNGKCIYEESHLGIEMDEILEKGGLN
ncbi:MAG TPA: bacillithiol system redox-active protein YtxJ [Puia sp.]|nr:bacillithiol system redox-active protein YtxJ [Puia sp.]